MKHKILITIFGILLLVSCKKDFLDLEPKSSVSVEQLATNPDAFQAVLDGIYATMRTYNVGGSGGHNDFGHKAMQVATDFMGQDQTMSYLHWFGFWYSYDGRVQSNSRARTMWITYYSMIAEANSIINALSDATTEDALYILGQAHALKGYFLLHLARVYAHTYIGHENDLCIPLEDGLNFDGKPRATVAETYAQIRSDLGTAVSLLDGFTRPNKQAIDQNVAKGMLAQVALEMGDYTTAATMASEARSSYGLMTGQEWLDDGFDDASGIEWMWCSIIDAESSTVFASFFSQMDNTSPGYTGILGVYKLIDARLYEMIPETDLRKQAFIDPVNGDPNYPTLPAYANVKFRDPTSFEGDYVYMRSSEMALIEAEAMARSGNNGGAASALFDLVSLRDPGYALSTNTGQALLDEIHLQRRIELWGEGFSWFDLKRYKKSMIRDYPGTNHRDFGLFNVDAESNRFRMQLPEDEINANPNISEGDQNPN